MKRDYRIDLLRVVAILAVLAIHCFGGKGTATNYINGFSRFSVPVFVMISAICCAPKLFSATSLAAFYKPRFAHVGIPLLVFSILYAAEDLIAGCEWSYVAKNFILGKPSFHLWFGFMILGVYVFMPFLVQLVVQINRFLLTCASCFVILMTWNVGYGLWSILPFVAYAMLALVLLPILNGIVKKSLAIRVTVGVLCLLAYVTSSSIVGSLGTHKAYTYTSTYSLCGSIAVLVATFALCPQNMSERSERIIATLSSCSFGVYLFHVIAIRGILRILPVLAEAKLSSAAALWGAVVIVSFATTFGASEIPVLRRIFGFKSSMEIEK